ncbi:hypothetical protein HDU76_013485 [Blyttiomyces sp. JEL0837]|nr:hypothetical protein HDU76_013485 [Blyttiomyces sp. JEL0837]
MGVEPSGPSRRGLTGSNQRLFTNFELQNNPESTLITLFERWRQDIDLQDFPDVWKQYCEYRVAGFRTAVRCEPPQDETRFHLETVRLMLESECPHAKLDLSGIFQTWMGDVLSGMIERGEFKVKCELSAAMMNRNVPIRLGVQLDSPINSVTEELGPFIDSLGFCLEWGYFKKPDERVGGDEMIVD